MSDTGDDERVGVIAREAPWVHAQLEATVGEQVGSNGRYQTLNDYNVIHVKVAGGLEEQLEVRRRQPGTCRRRIRHEKAPTGAVAPVGDSRVVLRGINQLQGCALAVGSRGPRLRALVPDAVDEYLLARKSAW